MNVLEEFWYGNLDPAEYDSGATKEYKELLQLIGRNEEKLLATMTEEQKDFSPGIQTASGNTRRWQSVCWFKTASAWVEE